MTGAQSLEIRTAAGVAMSVASLAAWTLASRIRMEPRSFRRLMVALYAASRLLLYFTAFVLLHMEARGDIYLYMQEAEPALSGKLVYRDFPTAHAPLSPYMMAGMLRLHHSPLTIILFAILFDIATFAIWMRVGERAVSRLTFRRAALLMLTNGTALLSVAIDGQMNALIALFLALGVLAWMGSRDTLSGILTAGAGICVKFLAWIYTPGFFFVERRKGRWAAGFIGITAAIYGAFTLIGADVRGPLYIEGAHKTSSNVVYLFELVTGHDLGSGLPDALLAFSWLAVVVLTWSAARAVLRHTGEHAPAAAVQVLALSMIAELMCVQVFSKNTWDRYLVMAMFPLCMVIANTNLWQFLAYTVWSMVNVSYRSFWATLANAPVAAEEHALLFHGNRVANTVLVGETLQTLGNILVLALCVQALLALRREPVTESVTSHLI